MKLGYFTMPMHPPGRPYGEVLDEEREAAVLADRLGFDEAYFGEHATDAYERITSSLAFIASLANITENIKLGSGTINLPNGHPSAFASQIAMLDHMLRGRFIMGVSAGALKTDAELFGTLGQPRERMFVECIEQILALWRGQAPYDLDGEFWKISTARSMDPELGLGSIPIPYQRPHPEIVCAALAPFSEGARKAAERGWSVISSNFLTDYGVGSHWTRVKQGSAEANLDPDPASWRVVRSIFVAEEDRTAKRYALSEDGPYAFMFRQIFNKLEKAGRLDVFKRSPSDEGPFTAAECFNRCAPITGTPEQVSEQILEFREETGPFGCLVYAGVFWQDPDLARRSMQLMADEVMPRINEIISK